MAKINIAGVKKTAINYTFHLVLTEGQEVDGEMHDVAIGEAFVPIPHDVPDAQARDSIVAAAQGIMEAHKDARRMRERAEAYEWPEIT